MTTRELLYIKTIADEKSMTRAAQKLFVTQPSLSHCVMILEQQLGTRLFTRTAGGLVLTYAGEKYYRMACEVLRVYAAFESEINEERALSQGRVTVGITNYLATAHLPRMLPAFHREHPGIEVRICEETTDQVERSLLSGRLDFAILHTGPDDGLTGNPSLDFEALGRDPFLIAAPHDERLAALAVQRPNAPHPELDPALLGGEPFLMVSPGQRIRQITDRVLAEAGVKPRVLLTSRNYELLRRLTSEGMGCMLLPSRYVGLLGGEGYQPAYYMIPPKYRAWWALSVVRLREAAGLLKLRVRSVLIAPAEIFFDAAGKQLVLLQHHAYGAAQRVEVVLAHVHAADLHAALRHVVETGMPTVWPEAMWRSMSRSAYFSAPAEYLKLTPSKSTEPSATVMTGAAGSVSADSSLKTSQIRLTDSADMVSIT